MGAADVTTILVLILGALGITTAAHVTGQAVNSAAGNNPPGPAPTKVV